MSRLVFYARTPSYTANRMPIEPETTIELAASENPESSSLAYDIPWPAFQARLHPKPEILQKESFDKELPKPCRRSECTEWNRVRSIDIGRCSIELPYGHIKPFGPSPVLSRIGHDQTRLGDMLLKGVLEQVKHNSIEGNALGRTRVTLTPDYENSPWHIANENDDICLDVRAKLSHKVIRFLGFIPISQRCNNKPLGIELCGAISSNTDAEISWETTSLDVRLLAGHSDCNKQVIAGVRNQVQDEVTGDSNAISAELTNELASAFTISGRQLYRMAQDAEDGGKTTRLLEIFGIRKECNNPEPYPGRKTETCFNNIVPGRCIANDVGDSSIGSCVIESPIQRIERTPTGIEVVLVDHEGKGRNDWIWQLTQGSYGTLLNVPLLDDISLYSCITSAADDPRNIHTPSRWYEGLIRTSQTVQLGEGNQ